MNDVNEQSDPTGRASEAGREGESAAAFATLLTEVRASVDARLEALFAERRPHAERCSADVHAMVGAVADLTMRGGKRFRPALVAAAHRACGGDMRDGDAVAAAGVALELLQTYLLVHDDWMDGDETRRGGPSVHVMLATHYGSVDRGAAAAVLAGDYASALALEQLASARTAPARVVEALAHFARIQQDAVYGQQLDLAGHVDVEQTHALKTGSYTVLGPLLLGAIIAGAGDAERDALTAYARPLGIAFQLRDDLLGAFGEPAQTGKPRGNDVRVGKRTALVAEAERRLSAAGRAALAGAYGDVSASASAVEAAVDALEACGARAAVEARLVALTASAGAALVGAPLRPTGARALAGAAEALTMRRT